MSVYIHNIEQSVPPHQYRQEELRDRMKEIVDGDEKETRLLHHIYNRSGIKTRHSVVDDFKKEGAFKLFFNGQGSSPGTQSRNDVYIEQGKKLFVDVAQKLIAGSDFSAGDITHLITVSCTGFYSPGPDFDIIKSLGLSPETERYNLGFMGCYAALPALKLAHRICSADPDANIMVVSVELCTLHFQSAPVTDNLISASVFADGGAGAIVSSQKPKKENFYRIDNFASLITPEGEKDMAWSIGDNGFNMVLSSYVPSILSSGIQPFMESVFKKHKLSVDQIDLWGVHPGGRAILDSFSKTLDLPKDSLQASRSVLSDYGNMSSATVLFVLRELLENNHSDEPQTAMAVAFGPGITIESALLTRMHS
ncbi:type III polyketide synthase [Rhodohalobacter sp. SW132]|uniref:type III polyketide synthase n=1 Tax=Rhodohalobacter sp. SW132 TaxID=2293433 RepID=UPI000E25CCBA|nr:type III polyketide synthase [Rhodohalobacter sp. SW132]REL29067.1 type III polyketide synthase [Rhodohalobacter sp. SW132]